MAPLFRTLLVPTDFSECSNRALALAASLARAHDATIVFLHASELTRMDGRSSPNASPRNYVA